MIKSPTSVELPEILNCEASLTCLTHCTLVGGKIVISPHFLLLLPIAVSSKGMASNY